MADETNPETVLETVPEETPVGASAGDDLGENGVKALKAEREARRTAEKQIVEMTAQLEAIRLEQMTEQEKALAIARAEGAEAATASTSASYEKRLLEATIKAQAAGRFRDPADALRLLDLSDLPRGADGIVAEDAIGSALDSILTEKPYLGLETSPVWPGADGGPQGPEAARSFTREQLKDPTFFQANREAILLAQREGRITQ